MAIMLGNNVVVLGVVISRALREPAVEVVVFRTLLGASGSGSGSGSGSDSGSGSEGQKTNVATVRESRYTVLLEETKSIAENLQYGEK